MNGVTSLIEMVGNRFIPVVLKVPVPLWRIVWGVNTNKEKWVRLRMVAMFCFKNRDPHWFYLGTELIRCGTMICANQSELDANWKDATRCNTFQIDDYTMQYVSMR